MFKDEIRSDRSKQKGDADGITGFCNGDAGTKEEPSANCTADSDERKLPPR